MNTYIYGFRFSLRNVTYFVDSIIEKAKQERVIPKDYAKDYISWEDSGDVRDPWN